MCKKYTTILTYTKRNGKSIFEPIIFFLYPNIYQTERLHLRFITRKLYGAVAHTKFLFGGGSNLLLPFQPWIYIYTYISIAYAGFFSGGVLTP